MNSCEIILIGKKVLAIDYLKGFSIFTIALMHLISMMSAMPSSIKTLSAIGGTGVHVFFVCSGIGLYMSYLYKKTSYVEFLRKRFLKIYIPYIIIVIISFFLPWLYSSHDKVMALLSHVFLFKMFVPKYEESFGTQFWFVSTIFQLYLIFIPMCCLKTKLKNSKIFVGIFLTTSVIWWLFCYIYDLSGVRVWSSFCLQYIWEFAIGIVIAEALYKGKHFIFSNYLLLVAALIGIGLQAGLALLSDVFKVFNDIPALIGYTSLALLLYNISFVKCICNKLAVFSYEYFLIHMLVFTTVFHFIKPQGLLAQCITGCVALIVALALAYSYYKFINMFRCNNRNCVQNIEGN